MHIILHSCFLKQEYHKFSIFTIKDGRHIHLNQPEASDRVAFISAALSLFASTETVQMICLISLESFCNLLNDREIQESSERARGNDFQEIVWGRVKARSISQIWIET